MSLANPKVGFVSLGCPKAPGRFRAHPHPAARGGLRHRPSYDDADVVVVNTCGFIDSAVTESLDAIGEAIAENGKVIVTGCLGKKPEQIREAHPGVLSISGPQDYGSVMTRCTRCCRPGHDPFPGPGAGHRHQAHAQALRLLKISEGCNPPLQLLHHPVDARRPGQPPGRPGAARSRETGDGRRQGTAGDLGRTPRPTAST
jgi:ribosomal protein S12 methylthiotransferase